MSDTVTLLKETESGACMAKDALEQVLEHICDKTLRRAAEASLDAHCRLGDRIHGALADLGEGEKGSGAVARSMSRLKTQWKLSMEEDDRAVAEILSEGCDMGIRTISRVAEKCAGADLRARDLAGELIALEEALSRDARAYLTRGL